MIKCFLSFIVILFYYTCAFSAPSKPIINGNVYDGQVVTVSGSSFGAKPTANPVVWDTFEGGANGNNIENQSADIGDWDTGTGSQYPIYSNSRVRRGSLASHHSFRPNISTNVSLAKNETFQNVYIDYWMYSTYLSTPSRNWKPWRVYGNNDDYQIDWALYCPANGNEVLTTYAGSCGVNVNAWLHLVDRWGRWVHVQAVLKESDISVANGNIRQYIDGYLQSNETRVTRCSSAHWNQVRIGHDWEFSSVGECGASTGGDVYIDDVYVDNTIARVEISDSSTYNASSHREIQIPSSWGDSSINVSVNTGTFTSGSTVYFYVVDSNGDISPASDPVTIGGGSATCDEDHLGLCTDSSSCSVAGGYWYGDTCNVNPEGSTASMPIGAGTMPIGAGTMPISVQ